MSNKNNPLRSGLPVDPEGMNDRCSAGADAAIHQFQSVTGADNEEALGDLLTDLMHWSDRHRSDFSAALDRARGHYDAEITEG